MQGKTRLHTLTEPEKDVEYVWEFQSAIVESGAPRHIVGNGRDDSAVLDEAENPKWFRVLRAAVAERLVVDLRIFC